MDTQKTLRAYVSVCPSAPLNNIGQHRLVILCLLALF